MKLIYNIITKVKVQIHLYVVFKTDVSKQNHLTYLVELTSSKIKLYYNYKNIEQKM